MKIKEVMSRRPVFIKEDEFLTRARQLIRDCGFRSLPIVDEKNRVKGVITIQDVLKVTSTKSNVTVRGFTRVTPVVTPDTEVEEAAKAMIEVEITRIPVVESARNPELVGMLSIVDLFRSINLDLLKEAKVEEIMTTGVKVASPRDNVAMIWANMVEFGLSGFPVVKGNRVIGIVTRSDILKSGNIRIGKESEGRSLNLTSKVEKIMKTPVFTITPDTTAKSAAEIMSRHNIGRIPVVSNGKLAGIVDRYDIMKSYIGVVG